MIEEVINKKIDDNYDAVIGAIVEYFGSYYSEDIHKKSQNIDVYLVRGNGMVNFGYEERYVDKEPVCVKREGKSEILFPIDFFKSKTGNVVFLHSLLHAIFEDEFKEDYEDLNEILVDYMANDIAKILEREKINVTFEKNPSYESESFYSRFFGLVENFYKENEDKIIDCMLGNDCAEKIYSIDVIAMEIENYIDKCLRSDKIEKNAKNKKR